MELTLVCIGSWCGFAVVSWLLLVVCSLWVGWLVTFGLCGLWLVIAWLLCLVGFLYWLCGLIVYDCVLFVLWLFAWRALVGSLLRDSFAVG